MRTLFSIILWELMRRKWSQLFLINLMIEHNQALARKKLKHGRNLLSQDVKVNTTTINGIGKIFLVLIMMLVKKIMRFLILQIRAGHRKLMMRMATLTI